jgi:hypothetical protein
MREKYNSIYNNEASQTFLPLPIISAWHLGFNINFGTGFKHDGKMSSSFKIRR